MSFSAGVYTLPSGNPVVTGTAITISWANTTLPDIATALTSCVLKDGTQTCTSSVPFDQGLTAGTNLAISSTGDVTMSGTTRRSIAASMSAGSSSLDFDITDSGGGIPAIRLLRTTTAGAALQVFSAGTTTRILDVSLAKGVTAFSTTAIPAGGAATTGFMVSSTANFGIFFGSSAPTLSAAKGSLYLRSDGTGTTDRAYINTNGTTTWTALTTVA